MKLPRSPDRGLVAHLERHLGPIVGGWETSVDSSGAPVQIVQYESNNGLTTFSTLGLSRAHLHLPVSGKSIHQELVLAIDSSTTDVMILAAVESVASSILQTQHALHLGEVFGPGAPLISDSEMEAFCATSPVFFPDEFAIHNGSSFQTVMVMLIPISRREAEFVQRNSWAEFEARLIDENPKLTDLYRNPLEI